MKGNKLQRPCPVCRNITGELLHTQKFVLPEKHTLSSQYDIVTCKKCGFVYADIPAKQETYDKYYAEMSKYDMHYTCIDSSLYIDRAAWIKKRIHCRNDSIIDIGCGNGQLLLELKKLGISDLTGLDPSAKCISDLKNKGICGITSSIFSVSTNKKYDCAILSGVLEHIYDVRKIMGTIQQLLKRNGLLFVCVPDASRYRDFDVVPYDYFNIEHINHFDEISLLNLGLQKGFITVNSLKTTITLSQTMQPMIFCVYENKAQPAVNWQSYSRNCVVDYIKYTNKNAKIKSIIDRLIKTREEVIVWGAGNYTSRLLAGTGLEKCNIVMIVDSDKHKQGTIIGGKTVKAPTVISSMQKPYTILIAAAVFHDEILTAIKRMKLSNNVIVLK